MFDLTPFHRKNDEMFNKMVKSFNDAFHNNWNWMAPFNEDFNSFRADIIEKENAYYVEAELPGFSKDDITIDIDNNRLTIHAKREQKNEFKNEKNNRVIHRERSYGEFMRTFYLDNYDEENIKAKLDNGILKVEIPKLHPEKPKRKQIVIE